MHPISAAALQPAIDAANAEGKPFNMGMVFPVSTHNYELRYWLAAGGLNPGFYAPGDATGQIGADVLLSVTPPPQMPATLEAGTIAGYSVGEPWNQAAVFKGIGVPVDHRRARSSTDNPEKVFGLTAEFVETNPNTTLALTKALIRAVAWLDADDGANRAEAVEILSRSDYVGADAEVIANSMTGTFAFEQGRRAPGAGLQHLLPRRRELSLLLRRRLDADPDAPLGADPRGEARRLVRRDREGGLQAGDLRGGRAAAGRRGQGRRPRTSPSAPTATRRRPPPSSTASNTTAAAPNDYLAKLPIGLKGGQTVTGAGVQG